MKNTIKLLGVLAAIAGGSLSIAQADSALVDTLVKKGYLSAKEATELKNSDFEVSAKAKHTKKIRFNGRLQFQYDNFSTDVSNVPAAVSNQSGSQNGFYFRRLFLGARADIGNGWGGYINADFGGTDGTVIMDSAYIYWKPDAYTLKEVDFGWRKVPFAAEETTSSSKLKTIERTIATRYFTEVDGLNISGRKTGVFLKGDFHDAVGYAFSLSNNDISAGRSDSKDTFNGNTNSQAVVGRLSWEVLDCDLGELELSSSLAYIKDGESNFDEGMTGVAGAGPLAAGGDVMAYELSAAYSIGGFNVSASFMQADIENSTVGTTAKDYNPYSWTVIPSYKVNDKIELVAAYSMINANGLQNIDVDDVVRRSGFDDGDGTAGGDVYDNGEQVYLGFNYYIMGNDLKLQTGYEFSKFENSKVSTSDSADVQGLRARLQLLF